MSDSEDDGDSENFESADENLTESEDSFETKVEPVTTRDRNETARYRKRPERIAFRPDGKSKSAKPVGAGTDQPKSEVFLKGVAGHISKNIDRSLDGILKTSSTIKDVVFRAFPSSENEKEIGKLNLFDDEVASERVKPVSEPEDADEKDSWTADRILGWEPEPFADEIVGKENENENAEVIENSKEEPTAKEKLTEENEGGVEGKPDRTPEPEVRLEAEPEPEPEDALGRTEGWEDFDFDEDEAVSIVSEEKNSPSKRDAKDLKASSSDSWWGVGSLLDTASAVTRGISTVLETGLGVPDPETLAAASKSEGIADELPAFPTFGITSLVAGVTSKIVDHSRVQEIGSKVISGGLDTLENIGKKTMQVLQEGDPGLKKKRALLLGNDKPVLSRVLREAKEKAEKEDKILAEKKDRRYCRFETLFDDYQGLVHLEALEMLSRQCELKLEQSRASSTEEEKRDLDGILAQVKELCDIEESDRTPNLSDSFRFKIVLQEAAEPLRNEVSTARIVQIHEEAEEWLTKSQTENASRKTVYRKAMSTIAELTAATAHQFHKAGELLSVKERRKTVEEAEALVQLTNLLCLEVDVLCNKFSKRLQKEDEDEAEAWGLDVKNIEIECENAISYIKQAFDLLIPVLQLGAT